MFIQNWWRGIRNYWQINAGAGADARRELSASLWHFSRAAGVGVCVETRKPVEQA
jgi:hypothetical protein